MGVYQSINDDEVTKFCSVVIYTTEQRTELVWITVIIQEVASVCKVDLCTNNMIWDQTDSTVSRTLPCMTLFFV